MAKSSYVYSETYKKLGKQNEVSFKYFFFFQIFLTKKPEKEKQNFRLSIPEAQNELFGGY